MNSKVKKEVEAILKLGIKYGVKNLEVSANAVKVEFGEAKQVSKPVNTKLVEEALTKQRLEAELDEMQLMDPAKYEELLAKEP